MSLFARPLRAALAAFRKLPESRALAIGGALGTAYARLRLPRTGDAMVNLRIAFPEWSDARRRKVLIRSFDNLGRSFAEFARLGVLDDSELRERVAVEGLEHLEAARKQTEHGGVVILTAHFGSWELLAAAMVARGIPVAVVHRGRDNPDLDDVVGELRASGGAELLRRGNAARAALGGIKNGRCLAMPYDQNCRRSEGVFVPFFGRLACTRDGPPRIAERSGAPVVPVFLTRHADGVHHTARFAPALELVPGRDREALTTNAGRMTQVIEEAIRRDPEQWIWIHRRFRTQPPGEPHPY